MCAPDKVAAQENGNDQDNNKHPQESLRSRKSRTTAHEDGIQSTTQKEVAVSQETKHSKPPQEQELTHAIRLCVASLGFLMMAATLTMPYMQAKRDELQCDSGCQGSMTSARSFLNLVGAALVGRVSDWPGMRRPCLWLGVAAAGVSLVWTHQAQTVSDLWMSLGPSLFQQNIHVLKALLSDYHSYYQPTTTTKEAASSASSSTSTTARAASAGMLGMSMGLAMMIGPLVGSSVLTSYEQTTYFSMALLLVPALLIFLLPEVEQNNNKSNDKKMVSKSFWSFMDVPSARTPAALFVLANRLLSAFSYHMFLVVWPGSLRSRFQFGPQDYGLYFSFVGLFLALSQGVMSKWVLQYLGGNTSHGRVQWLVACSVVTALARFWAFYTSSLALVYVLMACFVTAMGVSSTIWAADTAQIAAPHEVGSFFGILAAVESGAGMAGPLVAGALASSSSVWYADPIVIPLAMVMVLNVISATMTTFGYERFVFSHIQQSQIQKTPQHQKQE